MDSLSSNAQQTLAALTGLEKGSVAQIRERTGKGKAVTEKALKELADAGLVTDSAYADGTSIWTVTHTQEPAGDDYGDPHATAGDLTESSVTGHQPTGYDDAETSTDEGDTSKDDTHDSGDETAEDDQTVNDNDNNTNGDGDGVGGGASDGDDPHGQAPTPAPARQADRRVLAVRGVLGDFPDGATFVQVMDATGYTVGALTRLLQAMEQADAIRHIPADADTHSPHRWIAGPGKAADVDPNPAPARCPACHQLIRVSTPKATTRQAAGRSGASANLDGNDALGRNVLRRWVLDFLNGRPGHMFTPQTIADELGTQHMRTISSGAVRNNCTTLAAEEKIRLASTSPLSFTANQTTTEADGQQQ